MSDTLEYCFKCDEPTGCAGRADDSHYNEDGEGPFCWRCWCENENPRLHERIEQLQSQLTAAQKDILDGCADADRWEEEAKFAIEELAAAEEREKGLRDGCLPDPLQIELGDGKVLVAKFQDTDGAAGVMFARGHGQFPVGTAFGNMAGKHVPKKGEVYIRCTTFASLLVLKDAVLEAEQALKEKP